MTEETRELREIETYLESLRLELELERELERRRQQRPLDSYRWLPGQHALLQSREKRTLLRAGNQGQGKTTGGAAELLFRMIGSHPFKRVLPPPTFYWAICASDQQAGVVQRKVWELAPKDLVHPDSEYDLSKGAFLGKYPRLLMKNGSWCGFKTGGGDTASLASEKLHGAWFDEPPESERVFSEVLKRLTRTNGDLWMTFTPVNRPVGWVRKRVDARKLHDLHFRLEPENLRFVDNGEPIRLEDGTVCDQAWIDRFIADTPDQEVPVVCHGEWEFRVDGAYLAKVWDPTRMVSEQVPDVDLEYALGIDFGDRPGKQVVVLLAIDEVGDGEGHPWVYVLDEYVATTGRETPEDDAKGVLAMLRRHRLRWSELKRASSDRAHKAGRGDQKSATDLQAQVARIIGVKFGQVMPPVRVAKRGQGRGAESVRTRARWLYQTMARGHFGVHPRCARLIEAIPRYNPWSDDDWKDPLDALVYGLDYLIFRGPDRGDTDRAPALAW